MKREAGVSAREAILMAANRIARTQGVGAMTLDAVVKEAGVSKGGLLYHFPGKEELIEGLLQAAVERFEALMARELEREPEGTPGRWTRALIRASFTPEVAEGEGTFTSLGLIEAAATNPKLRTRIRAHYRHWYEKITDDGLDPALAIIIHLVTDGYLMAMLLQLEPAKFVKPDELKAKLLELAQPSDAPAKRAKAKDAGSRARK
jgi:AcrR family transcriptional regulator